MHADQCVRVIHDQSPHTQMVIRETKRTMSIVKQCFSRDRLDSAGEGAILVEDLLPREIPGVKTRFVSIKGPGSVAGGGDFATATVLLFLGGNARLTTGAIRQNVTKETIARIPYGGAYGITVRRGAMAHCLEVTKALDAADQNYIAQNMKLHTALYLKKFKDSEEYTEGIKSKSTINRMLLPEGYVPRFTMGSVRTRGPDKVGSHVHPMLDQLYLGMEDCRCTIHAGRARTVLTADCLLHIPLASHHGVTVDEGDTLYYLWFDFFLTLEGQEYMSREHHMKGKAAGGKRRRMRG